VPFVTAPVVAIDRATHRSLLLSIEVGKEVFSFLAGQAVMAGLHRQGDLRPYSIACSPERLRESGRLELLVALERGTGAATHLSRAEPGALVELRGPIGSFTFPTESDQGRVLFVAGGTGIAPLRSMLDHALRRDQTRFISLLYSVRRRDEFVFIEELRAHALAGRIELHQTVTRDDSTWEGRRGRIGREHFEAVLHDPVDTLCFVCGPPLFVSESVAMLEALGVPDDLIRTERWDK